MFKLIGLIIAAMPVVLFLRTILRGQLKKSQAFSEFKKNVDYVVWAILVMIGCSVLYAVVKFALSWGQAATP